MVRRSREPLRSAVGVARVVLGGALVAPPVLTCPPRHDKLRVVLLDLVEKDRRPHASQSGSGAGPMPDEHGAVGTDRVIKTVGVSHAGMIPPPVGEPHLICGHTASRAAQGLRSGPVS